MRRNFSIKISTVFLATAIAGCDASRSQTAAMNAAAQRSAAQTESLQVELQQSRQELEGQKTELLGKVEKAERDLAAAGDAIVAFRKQSEFLADENKRLAAELVGVSQRNQMIESKLNEFRNLLLAFNASLSAMGEPADLPLQPNGSLPGAVPPETHHLSVFDGKPITGDASKNRPIPQAGIDEAKIETVIKGEQLEKTATDRAPEFQHKPSAEPNGGK